jgi:hypothetical protein
VRWLWRRRDRRIHVDLTVGHEAAAARKEAESRWPEVRAVVEAHRRVREENHFGPRLAAAFETRRQP